MFILLKTPCFKCFFIMNLHASNVHYNTSSNVEAVVRLINVVSFPCFIFRNLHCLMFRLCYYKFTYSKVKFEVLLVTKTF